MRRHTPAPPPRPTQIVALLIIAIAACGGGSNDVADAATTAVTTAAGATTVTAGAPAAEPPSLTLVVEDIGGFRGLLLVGSLVPADGRGGAIGSVCAPIDRDPWNGGGVFATFEPDNPCGQSPPYGKVIAERGDYTVTVGVYTPGEQAPAACATREVTISGPTELRVTGADLVPNCTG